MSHSDFTVQADGWNTVWLRSRCGSVGFSRRYLMALVQVVTVCPSEEGGKKLYTLICKTFFLTSS